MTSRGPRHSFSQATDTTPEQQKIASDGSPVRDRNFRNRVWYPAIESAGVRRFPPRITRHTTASWLVQDGVPLYDAQALLGHESFATTQRYAHLAPDAHSKVIESWSRRTARR